MSTTANISQKVQKSATSVWSGGGVLPFNARYGKLMMWFFLLSDAFTFSGLLIVYGFFRFTHNKFEGNVDDFVFSQDYWPISDQVFNAYPFSQDLADLTGNPAFAHVPMVFVTIMTFVLILSSVTMVLAVDAGKRLDRKGVEKWLLWTLLGGITFLSCQAWEWTHFIHGSSEGTLMNVIKNGVLTQERVYGASLAINEYGPQAFAALFFFITGFHGTHVLSGVVINYIVFYKTSQGVYDRKRNYEMIEKVGLYWHFVDLVWVFVFTFFYLV